MVRFVCILLFLVFSFESTAQITSADKAFIPVQNILKNPGFEPERGNNSRITNNWTASGGSFLSVTSGSNLLTGLGSVTWDSSAASQSLRSIAVAIPKSLYGRNGVASCVIQTPSGTATHTIGAYDGTNSLVPTPILSSATPSRNSSNFIFPSSGNIQLEILSVASDESLIAIDDCYLGQADGYNLSSINVPTEFSAFVTDGISTTTISLESPIDWINGVCTNGSTGNYVCSFVTGVFTSAPNCILQTSGTNLISSITTTSSAATISLISRADSVTASDGNFALFCYKTDSDNKLSSYTPDLQSLSVFAYKNGGTVNNATIATWTAESGNGIAHFDASTGIFTVPKAGDYNVQANVGFTVTTNENIEIRVNGSAVASKAASGNGTNAIDALLTGLNRGDTILIHATGNKTFTSSTTATTLSIFNTSQSMPAPVLTGAVATASSGVTGFFGATVNMNGDAVSNETGGNWINGNCTNAGTGLSTCTYSSGIFSSTPVCSATVNKTSAATTREVTCTAGGSSVTCVGQVSGTTTAIDLTFDIICIGPR